MIDDGMDEIIQEFLVESAENLDQLDSDLVALERDPTSRQLLGSIFRAIHTIKGTTGFLGFSRLERLAHVAENLLSKLRDGQLALDADRTTALLQAVDAIRGLLALIETTGDDVDDRDLSVLMTTLTNLLTPPESVPPTPAADAEAAVPPEMPSPVTETPASIAAEPESVAEQEAAAPVAPVLATAGVETTIAATDRTIRVDVELLDILIRQMGELVLARNQVVSRTNQLSDAGLTRTVQRLSLIVSEVQEGLMKTRMQPIDHLWAKVPRLVRDLTGLFGKQIDVILEGGDTELDRSIMEAVKDPLTHLMRNAADHGIESPDIRVAKGKPATGRLTLRAAAVGGHVVLEMIDDGAGIDPSKVGLKALERGLVSADELDRMTEREVIDLIFRAGFSTAEVVTNVSGRGVGMDVVRTNIEKIGGTVDLQSVPGQGTTFRIKVPLTLAIIPALLLGCQGARYAVPQAAVQELVRLEGDTVTTGIERIDSAMVYRLRGRLLPLVRLDQSLGYDPEPLDQRSSIDIVVLRNEVGAVGLIVDEVHETQEIVVKPLSTALKQIPVFAGATILGDGGVALILDVSGLADAARVRDSYSGSLSPSAQPAHSRDPGAQALLILRIGADRRVAIPLAQVVRLEEVEAAKVEHAGNRRVIQYRDDLLPLVWLTDLLGVMPAPSGDSTMHVVVSSDGTRSVGFVADEILDVVEEVLQVKDIGRSTGALGTVVLKGSAAELLDVPSALAHWGVSLVSDEALRDVMEGMTTNVR